MSKTSERIKALRLQSGLSADELGRRIGKNRATVYRYESDDIESMPVSILQPLSDALHTTPEYLMGWTDEASPPSPVSSPDERFLAAYHAADPIYQQIVLELLESHPKKSTEEIK